MHKYNKRPDLFPGRPATSMLSLWKKRLSARYHPFYSAGGLDATLAEPVRWAADH
jgi:hypothetical protein